MSNMTADKDALLREAQRYIKLHQERMGLTDLSLLARITAALKQKDDGGWTYSSVVPSDVYFIESHFEGKPLMANRGGRWYLHSPLPPLPKGDE